MCLLKTKLLWPSGLTDNPSLELEVDRLLEFCSQALSASANKALSSNTQYKHQQHGGNSCQAAFGWWNPQEANLYKCWKKLMSGMKRENKSPPQV